MVGFTAMTRRTGSILTLFLLGLSPAAGTVPPESRGPSLAAAGLTCEHRVDPLGIAALPPRLSWKLATIDERARGLSQGAYQVLVASDEAGLARDRGDRWDSGRVASSETVDIEYGGAPLGSGARCFWKVRVWD